MRRRERFRKGVVVMVVAMAALLVVLLVQGCMNEHARTSGNAVVPLKPATASNGQIVKVEPMPQNPVSLSPASPSALPQESVVAPTPAAPTTVTLPISPKPQLVYTVKPGDTLSRIARTHQTTVDALKSANGLESDTIIVGDTLKLPSA